MAATVSGLLPQHGACSEITALPVASILMEALSGELVSANPGARLSIQNSVALNTPFSWQLATPMPT